MTQFSKSNKDRSKSTGLPAVSGGIFSDIRYFLLQRPSVPTLIDFASDEERENYSHRMMQRLGISVKDYTILNVHRIGIDVPVKYVFEELLRWDKDSSCWPNHIARVERIDGRLEHIRIYLFGRKRKLFPLKSGLFGLNSTPLFDLKALKFQHLPDKSDFDNARYLLYESSGGYPIGIFAVYTRSSIAEEGEIEKTQMFFAVGFNFYGKEDWSRTHIISKIWEMLHNRVTANVMNRIKQVCEAKFQKVVEGLKPI